MDTKETSMNQNSDPLEDESNQMRTPSDKKNELSTDEIEEKILFALEEIRPFLQRDGGDVSLVSIENNEHVKVRLEGTCAGCSINAITLKMGVENTIKKYVPSIKSVEDVGLEVEE